MVDFLNPKGILSKIRLKENMVAVDFGCGSGGWVIPLAQKLEKGRVFAIDLLEEPLSVLDSNCREKNIVNVKPINSDVEKGSTLNDESVDLVLMTNLLFQVEDKEKVLKEASRVLKKEGMVLVVDWREDALVGPEEGRVSSEKVKSMAEKMGFQLEKEMEAGNYHYALLFKK